jgi:hypothetical protein
MTYRPSAKGLLRAARHGLARLDRLLAEAGNSDEDLIFQPDRARPRSLRNAEASGSPVDGRGGLTDDPPRHLQGRREARAGDAVRGLRNEGGHGADRPRDSRVDA